MTLNVMLSVIHLLQSFSNANIRTVAQHYFEKISADVNHRVDPRMPTAVQSLNIAADARSSVCDS